VKAKGFQVLHALNNEAVRTLLH